MQPLPPPSPATLDRQAAFEARLKDELDHLHPPSSMMMQVMRASDTGLNDLVKMCRARYEEDPHGARDTEAVRFGEDELAELDAQLEAEYRMCMEDVEWGVEASAQPREEEDVCMMEDTQLVPQAGAQCPGLALAPKATSAELRAHQLERPTPDPEGDDDADTDEQLTKRAQASASPEGTDHGHGQA